MTAAAIVSRAPTITRVRRDVSWAAILAIAVFVALLVNPLGYIGGGWDDWQYLNAARCWREHGPCLPNDHWQARWPIIAPVAFVTWLLGESRASVGIAPLIAGLTSLYLLAAIGNRSFGKPVGWFAALLLLTTPAFAIQLLDIAVEATELAFILGGFLAVQIWLDRETRLAAAVAGLCFGLALQLRETSLIPAVLSAVYILVVCQYRLPRYWPSAVAMFALPLLFEFTIFALQTGDPLFRRTLSIRHTLVPSSELLGPINNAPPFFNAAYIANWRHEPGLHVHWAIDGLINLFVNPKAGLSLRAVPLLLLVPLGVAREDRRRAALLFGCALIAAAALIYGLAIDPKARMMFVPLSLSCTALALLLCRLSEIGKRLLAGCIFLGQVGAGLLVLYGHQRTDVVEGPASRWIEAHPNQIEIDENTRRHLALVRSARALAPLESSKRYLLYNSISGCEAFLSRSGLPHGSLSVMGEAKISKLGWLDPKLSGALCFYRYNKQVPGDEIRQAIRRSRSDALTMVGSRRL